MLTVFNLHLTAFNLHRTCDWMCLSKNIVSNQMPIINDILWLHLIWHFIFLSLLPIFFYFRCKKNSRAIRDDYDNSAQKFYQYSQVVHMFFNQLQMNMCQRIFIFKKKSIFFKKILKKFLIVYTNYNFFFK